jgi:dolichol kinase
MAAKLTRLAQQIALAHLFGYTDEDISLFSQKILHNINSLINLLLKLFPLSRFCRNLSKII